MLAGPTIRFNIGLVSSASAAAAAAAAAGRVLGGVQLPNPTPAITVAQTHQRGCIDLGGDSADYR